MWYLTAGTLLLDCERHSLTTFRRNVPTVPMLCSHETATWYDEVNGACGTLAGAISQNKTGKC
jgi:hypothetical protein